MDQVVLSDLSHMPRRACCVNQVHYVCGVRNHLSLSEQEGTNINVGLCSTILLSEQRVGCLTHHCVVNPSVANVFRAFESARA